MAGLLGQMPVADYSNLCRLCGCKFNILMGVQIFEEEGGARQLYKKIVECLPIQVHTDDKLPKIVCDECVFKLDEFCDFRDKCVKTETALNNVIKNMFVCSDIPMESLLCQQQDHIKLPSALQDLQVPGLESDLASLNIPIEDSVKHEGSILNNFTQPHDEDFDSSQDSDGLVNPSDSLMLPSHVPASTNGDKRMISSKDLLATDWLDCCEGCGKPGSSSQCTDCLNTEPATNLPQGKKCPECGKVYRNNYKLAQHMWRHTGEKPFKCSQCDKTFRSKIGLSQHEAKHTGQYEYSCNTCGKGFQCKSYLMVHQRVHSDIRPYDCDTCGASFKSKQSLLDHRNRHLGLKPYLCEVCGRGFITKGLCKSHQKVHSGTDNRQYPCSVCNKMFVSKSYLATHMRIHTGEKPYMCEVCGKGFLTRVDLRIHSTVHTGEKSFVCEMCGKAFARRDALRCHLRSHTGERPYRCDICGQGFTQFSPMAIHKRLHTGERPYSCDICSKTFVSKSTMMSHRKKHIAQTVS